MASGIQMVSLNGTVALQCRVKHLCNSKLREKDRSVQKDKGRLICEE